MDDDAAGAPPRPAGAFVAGPAPSRDEVFLGARELFSLDPAVAYLNHGGYGAVPVPVQREQARLRDELEANPMAFYTGELAERIAGCRAQVARFLRADPHRTALVANATTAASVVLTSILFQPGEEILLTDHGYGAVRLAVGHACYRTGAVARDIAIPVYASDDEIVERITAAVTPGRTRLVVVDHVCSPTAKLFPVARIVSALRELGVTVAVDAAHAPGMLELDVEAVGADFWFGNLHKWAFTARPCAVLVVATHSAGHVQPLVVSWDQPRGYPSAVEMGGTLDYTAWLAAPTGLALMESLGVDAIRRHNHTLVEAGARVVADALDMRDQLAGGPTAPVSMRWVPLPHGIADTREEAAALRQRLAREYACVLAVDAWQGRGFVRLSAQIYNRLADYERLAGALRELIRTA